MVFHADSYMMEELLFGLIPVLTSAVPSLLVGIASYVLTSLALYTLASRRGIRKAWLSWVPVLNVWIVGSLSDQYRYVVKGQVRSKRKILLTLKLLSLFLGLCAFTVAAFTVADAVHSTLYGVRFQMILRQFMAPVMGILGLGLPIAGLSIAALVFYYMALYDIYVSMDPGNSVLFTVLSILFRVTKPVFLFINRNKDGGMPPRREVPRQEPPCQEEETREYL